MKPLLAPYIEDAKVIVFVGAGGVGKSTCACATATWLSHQGIPNQLVSIDPAHSLHHCLPDPHPLTTLVEFDATKTAREFQEHHHRAIEAILAAGTILDEEDVRELLELSVPGVIECVLLTEIVSRSQGDQVIILDTPPGTHTLQVFEAAYALQGWIGFLEVMLAKPRHLARTFGSGKIDPEVEGFLLGLRRDSDAFMTLMTSGDTRILAVCGSGRASQFEAERLRQEMTHLSVSLDAVILNGVGTDESSSGLPFQAHIEFPEVTEPVGQLTLLDLFHRGQTSTPVAASIHPLIPNIVATHRPTAPVVILTGKGGVGKTTLSAALAVTCPGRALLVHLQKPSDPEFWASVDAVADCVIEHEWIDSEKAWKEFHAEYMDELALVFDFRAQGVDLVFDRPVFEHLLDLSPLGLHQVVGLMTIVDAFESQKYTQIVVDAPATGHLLDLIDACDHVVSWIKLIFRVLLKHKSIFKLPNLSERLISLLKRVRKFRAQLEDQRTVILVVTIPGRVVAAERDYLHAELGRRGIHAERLILNRATIDDLTESQRTMGGLNIVPWVQTVDAHQIKQFGNTLFPSTEVQHERTL